MAKLYNLARMTTATTGTGTITLGSAVPSYVTFAAAGAQNGETVTYAIADGNNREVGRGVYTSSGTTLTRATILESTNSNLAINLSGNAEVFITAAAEDIANVNETNTFTASQIIEVTDNTNAALRITQLGTGDAIRVEDSTTPDSTSFRVDQNGAVTAGGAITSGSTITLPATSNMVWSGRGNLTSPAAGGIQLGQADLAAPVAQTLSAQSVVAGTADTAGQILTIRGSRGTGSAAGGAIAIQTAPSGTAGTTQNAAVERMRITSAGSVGIGTNAPTHMLTVGEDSSGNPGNISIGRGGLETSSIFFTRNGVNDAEITYLDSETLRIYNNFVGTPLLLGTEGTERLRIANNGNVLVTGSAGLGYGSGAGGTVTQATSKSTAVTLNKPTGQITMNNAALAAATSVTFTLNNSLLTAQDTLIVNHSTTGGTSGAYLIEAITVGAGTVVIRVTNITGGSLSEAAVINFTIIKGVTS
jgi:hypothetical protein